MLQLKTVAAALGMAAGMAVMGGASADEAAMALMKKSLGTTEGVNAVLVEAIEHAATPLTPEQRELALKCWKDSASPPLTCSDLMMSSAEAGVCGCSLPK